MIIRHKCWPISEEKMERLVFRQKQLGEGRIEEWRNEDDDIYAFEYQERDSEGYQLPEGEHEPELIEEVNDEDSFVKHGKELNLSNLSK